MTQDLGFVETPEPVAKCIANNLIHKGRDGRILYPGIGRGRIRDAVVSVARRRSVSLEEVGVERDPERIEDFEASHPDADVDVQEADFLLDPPEGEFDYIAMNPPYVRFTSIPEAEREAYREQLEMAGGRFDLYHLFVEQALDLLAPDGVLVAVIPDSWYHTSSAAAFRDLIHDQNPYNHILVPDDAFDVKVRTCILAIENNADGSGFGFRTMLHPYDVMDLSECATFDNDYYDLARKKRKKLHDTFSSAVKDAGDDSDDESTSMEEADTEQSPELSQAALTDF